MGDRLTDAPTRTFHIDLCLGRGGFGEVYRARMVRDGFEADVAIKLLRADVDPSTQAAQRLRDEARMLGLVRHPAVPKVYDLIELDGRMALVTEYIEGADLRQCLKDDPPIPTRPALEVLSDVADALHAAWVTPLRDGPGTLQIVHRDLKPANIRIDRDGVPKLLDFGIAWTESISRSAHTQTAALIGSPAYMAPERFDGSEPSPANDVYALGSVLFECLSHERLLGHIGFRTLAGIALFSERFQSTIAERLKAVPDDVDPELRALMVECLQWSPDRRPTAYEFARRARAIEARIEGPTLKNWCRGREWPVPRRFDSPWIGRTLQEGRQTLRETRLEDQLPDTTWEGPVTAANQPFGGETMPFPPPDAEAVVDPSLMSVEVEPLPDPTSVSIDHSAPRRAIAPRSEPPRQSTRLLVLTSALFVASAVSLYMAWQQPTGRMVAPAPSPTPAVAIVVPPEPVRTPEEPAQPTTQTPRPQVVSTPRPTPRSTPTPTPRATPRATPRPRTTPRATPKARIAPVATPAPTPHATPAPVLHATSLTSASRVHRVALIGGGRTWILPDQVPAGRYEIRAEFIEGLPVPAGNAEISRATKIACVAQFKTCTAR